MSQQHSKLNPFVRFMFATGVENSYPTIAAMMTLTLVVDGGRLDIL